MDLTQDLERIERGLTAAAEILLDYASTEFTVREKTPGDPVTEADLAADKALFELLPSPGDGWLSEETTDSPARLSCNRVWIVDPLDGTREFIRGNPEWSVSIALAVGGIAVAGGICNPQTGERIVGALNHGVQLNGVSCHTSSRAQLAGASVLASRSEVRRGEWKQYAASGLTIHPVGSVAYKMGLAATGQYDAMWTLSAKSEWDVSAGTALIHAAGGEVCLLDGKQPVFNKQYPQVPGLIASGSALMPAIKKLLNV